MRTILTLTLCSLALAEIASAQRQDVVELEGGGGHVFGSGTEDPGPSLPTVDAAVVVWVTEHWGVALRRVEGPGEDLYVNPVEIPDRRFLGVGHLRYWTVTARHRQPMFRAFGLEIGVGMMFAERFADIEMFRDPRIGRIAALNGPAHGLSLEALVTHPLARHFEVKAGITDDFNVETNHFQPVALAVVRV